MHIIAQLTDAELCQMSREDLMGIVRATASALPQQDYFSHMPYMEREQLEQLAHLARHSCQLMQPEPLPSRPTVASASA